MRDIEAAGGGERPPVYTIGHSTRTIAQFVDLLRVGQVKLVVDIRTIPKSRTNPQYNSERLTSELADYQIAYRRIAALGGLRKHSPGVAEEINGFWQNRSFHNYADYALSGDFDRGLEELLDLSASRPTAIMCSEAVWWRCHRRIVADYLLLNGREVFHLMGEKRVEPARMTPAATESGRRLVYPAAAAQA